MWKIDRSGGGRHDLKRRQRWRRAPPRFISGGCRAPRRAGGSIGTAVSRRDVSDCVRRPALPYHAARGCHIAACPSVLMTHRPCRNGDWTQPRRRRDAWRGEAPSAAAAPQLATSRLTRRTAAPPSVSLRFLRRCRRTETAAGGSTLMALYCSGWALVPLQVPLMLSRRIFLGTKRPNCTVRLASAGRAAGALGCFTNPGLRHYCVDETGLRAARWNRHRSACG